MHFQSLAGRCRFREAETNEWLPAQVPGSVHTDLLALGRIPDPFVADNELRVQWVSERDWEYRLTFQVAPEALAEERVFLVCDALDTLADITLNGQPVGHAENMFRRYRWDVTSLLTEGENELRVYFWSPVTHIRARQSEQPLASPSQCIPGGPYLRKAPCQFGWDWGPQLPPIGIWRDVRLEGYSVARLDDVHLRQRHSQPTSPCLPPRKETRDVIVSADVRVERWGETDLQAILRLIAPDGRTQEVEVPLKGKATDGTLEVEVPDPQLWWPNGLGAQPLYQIEVALYHGQSICDRRTYQLGLHTLELRQEDDQFGTSFTFVVNRVPIFAKGANWIPADSFPTRINSSHLEYLIHSAARAHMNMLRVWGGGFYESERFYDLCDQHGILVWQDFIFSCSTYPDDESFFENVRAEAVENVRRLRHRACLALWCGNNEMEWQWNDSIHPRFKEAYDRMFHHLLPEICAAEDPDHPYWPSSPSSNTPFEDPNGGHAGNTHCWTIWHGGESFTDYPGHVSRFVTEFGFQSLPALETVRTYADESEWDMASRIMEHHQRSSGGNDKIMAHLADHFLPPKDFESLIYLTQLLQAEAVRTGVENWRRNRLRTSGTLYWQLNDCWPVTSWSSLDYFGRWKALHYAARRFYAPVLLSLEGQGAAVALHVTSDLAGAWPGTVCWSLETLAGEVLKTGEEGVVVPALSSVCLGGLDFSRQVNADNRCEVVLTHELWRGDERLSMGLAPFVPTKCLKLTNPGLHTDIRETGEGLQIEITAQRLARFVWLALDSTDLVFSDNYFDLPAGRMVTVRLPRLDGWTAERMRASLRVRSLVDSFPPSISP